MTEIHARTKRLIGDEAFARLQNAKIAVFGLGGVGGAAAWGLSRSGIGFLRLIDCDEVAISNLNRQMIADYDTIGKRKTDAAETMIRRYNKDSILEKCDVRATKEIIPALCENMDAVLDCIDDVAAKEELAVYCVEHNIPIFASMGTGNKLEASCFSVMDLAKTQGDPLARVMRKRLKDRGITHLPVCISSELPIAVPTDEEGKHSPASIAFVPPSAGLVLAGEIVKRIIKGEIHVAGNGNDHTAQ